MQIIIPAGVFPLDDDLFFLLLHSVQGFSFVLFPALALVTRCGSGGDADGGQEAVQEPARVRRFEGGERVTERRGVSSSLSLTFTGRNNDLFKILPRVLFRPVKWKMIFHFLCDLPIPNEKKFKALKANSLP